MHERILDVIILWGYFNEIIWARVGFVNYLQDSLLTLGPDPTSHSILLNFSLDY